MTGSELAGTVVLIGAVGGMLWWLVSQPDPERAPRQLMAADPLLDQARSEARHSVDLFRELLAAHPKRGLVKQRVNRADGVYRGRWADVVSVSDAGVVGMLRGLGSRIELAWEELEDWQVTLPDGTFRGAFTVMARWRIQVRDHGALPIDATREVARFRDWR